MLREEFNHLFTKCTIRRPETYASKFGGEDNDVPRPRKVNFSVTQPGQEGGGMSVSVTDVYL